MEMGKKDLTVLQYRIARMLGDGYGQMQIIKTKDLPKRRDTLHSHIVALRSKGVISKGQPGKRGSIPFLARLGDIKIKEVMGHAVFDSVNGTEEINAEWMTDTAKGLIKSIYDQPIRGRDHTVAAILADALQDAGCDNEKLLATLRLPISNGLLYRPVHLNDQHFRVEEINLEQDIDVLRVARVLECLHAAIPTA